MESTIAKKHAANTSNIIIKPTHSMPRSTIAKKPAANRPNILKKLPLDTNEKPSLQTDEKDYRFVKPNRHTNPGHFGTTTVYTDTYGQCWRVKAKWTNNEQLYKVGGPEGKRQDNWAMWLFNSII